MWSFPSYDPNLLATHNFEDAETARQFLLQAPGDPLVPATYRERYFPGSTFKTVTASAGLESGQVTATEPVYPVSTSYTPPLTTRPIQNFGGSACGGDLFNILRVSCNTAFAQMGVDLGPEVMVGEAEAYGFNDRPPLDLPVPAPSAFPPVSFFDLNTPALAQAAIGQNDVQATPLQMALVAAGVANGGVVMQPHVMQEVRNSDGEVIDEGRAAHLAAASLIGERGRDARRDGERRRARHGDPHADPRHRGRRARPAPPSSAPTRRARTRGSSASRPRMHPAWPSPSSCWDRRGPASRPVVGWPHRSPKQ